jgi:hypothetical protein
MDEFQHRVAEQVKTNRRAGTLNSAIMPRLKFSNASRPSMYSGFPIWIMLRASS